MSKFWVFLVIIILVGVLGYVYYKNTSDVGVQIERLKLKYAISPNSDAENIANFSKAVGELKTSDIAQKERLNFEKNYYAALAANKIVTSYLLLNRNELFTVNCSKDEEFKNALLTSGDAKGYYLEAEGIYANVKPNYLFADQEDWDAKLVSLKEAIAYNDDILNISCPTQ